MKGTKTDKMLRNMFSLLWRVGVLIGVAGLVIWWWMA